MSSLLNTGNDILIPTPVTTTRNPLVRIPSYDMDIEDQVSMSFKTTLRELDLMRTCILNERNVGKLKNGDITAFVQTTIPHLAGNVFDLMENDVGRHEIEQALFDEGVMITLNPDDKATYHVYLTQKHYFVAAPAARRAPDVSTDTQAVNENESLRTIDSLAV